MLNSSHSTSTSFHINYCVGLSLINSDYMGHIVKIVFSLIKIVKLHNCVAHNFTFS